MDYKRNYDILRVLVDAFYQIQKQRVAFGLRLSAIERGVDEADTLHLQRLERWHERFEELEAVLEADLAEELEYHPVWPWLSGVKGIGTRLGAKLLGLTGDIANAPTISSLWKFAGLAPGSDRLVKGEKACFNRRLKSVCWLIGKSMLMCNSPYRTIYDEAKAEYQLKQPAWTDGHRHNAARRKMVKIFLSHLWTEWRKAVDLPVSDPYPIAILRHGHRVEITG